MFIYIYNLCIKALYILSENLTEINLKESAFTEQIFTGLLFYNRASLDGFWVHSDEQNMHCH